MSPIATKPAGTFCDVGVLNHNQAGDETLEVWIQEVVSGSGDVTEEGGVAYGGTDFSEFPVGAGIPAGLTQFDFQAGDPDSFGIADDPEAGHYFAINTSFGVANRFWAFGVDAFNGGHIGEEFGDFEMLARTWIPGAAVATHELIGPACAMDAAGWQAMAMQRTSSGPHLSKVTAKSSSIQTALMQEARQDDVWVWQRFRRISAGGTAYDFYWKAWFGELEDEPAGWDGTSIGTTINVAKFAGAIGFSGQGVPTTEEQRIAFLSFTSDPLTTPPPSGDLGIEGEWTLAASVAVGASADQVVRITGLTEATNYNVALRYRRGLKYNAGAEGSDPGTWPAISRGQFTTTVNPPEITNAVWSRTAADAEKITLTIVPEITDENIVVYRNGPTDSEFTPYATISAPHAAEITWADDEITGESAYEYYVRSSGDNPSPPSEEVRVWAGPAGIPTLDYAIGFLEGYEVGWTNGDATLATEIHDTYDDNGGVEAYSLRATEAAGEVEHTETLLANVPAEGVSFAVRLRHKATAFTVDDYGEFSTPGLVNVEGDDLA